MWHDKDRLNKSEDEPVMKKLARNLLTPQNEPEIRKVRLDQHFQADKTAAVPVKIVSLQDKTGYQSTEMENEPIIDKTTTPREAEQSYSPYLPQPKTWGEAKKIINHLSKAWGEQKDTKPSQCKNFKESRKLAAFYLPNPIEYQLRQEPDHRDCLLNQVNTCRNILELSSLAYQLNSRDLAIIFPTLASLDFKEDEEVLNKLMHIISLRASKYLYIHGWVTLQYVYTRPGVQMGLTLLCQMLETQAKQKDQKLINGIDNLPSPPLNLGPDHFDWWRIRLISDFARPTDRQFIRDIYRKMREYPDMKTFFTIYGIYPNLPLGQAIRKQWEMANLQQQIHRQHTQNIPRVKH